MRNNHRTCEPGLNNRPKKKKDFRAHKGCWTKGYLLGDKIIVIFLAPITGVVGKEAALIRGACSEVLMGGVARILFGIA